MRSKTNIGVEFTEDAERITTWKKKRENSHFEVLVILARGAIGGQIFQNRTRLTETDRGFRSNL